VVGTHGRAIWILDDATPLRQLTQELVDSPAALLKPEPGVLFIRGPGFDDGTPLPLEEPQAKNPPNGATIDYYISKSAKSVELTITDSSGKELRKYSSADKPTLPDVTKLTIAPVWIRTPSTLSTEAGAHRFVWEFAGRGEAVVAPGDYKLTLNVDGKKYQQTLKVVDDPRSGIKEQTSRTQH
jgi:hypothetical protein